MSKLIDRINEFYIRADNYLLDQHRNIAEKVNSAFGISNYDLSSSFAFVSPFPFIGVLYSQLSRGELNPITPMAGLAFAATAKLFIDYNKGLQKNIQNNDAFIEDSIKPAFIEYFGPVSITISLLSSLDIIYNSILNTPETNQILVEKLEQSTVLLFSGMSSYFSRVGNIPPRKGKIKELFEAAKSYLPKSASV